MEGKHTMYDLMRVIDRCTRDATILIDVAAMHWNRISNLEYRIESNRMMIDETELEESSSLRASLFHTTASW